MPTDELASAEATLGALQHVLHPISRDELSQRTPCTKYDVAQLTDHLLNSITVIGGAAGATLPDSDSADSVERQIIGAARHALDAWHCRGLNGTVTVGANEVPAKFAAGVLSIEFLVHAWDYATAMGRDVDVADSVIEYVLRLAERIITPQGRSTVGFADPVAIPDDSPVFDRLIAFTGRDPSGRI